MKWWLLVVESILLVAYPISLAFSGESRTVEQLAEVQARHEAAIMALPGVIGIGTAMSNGQLVVRVLVDEDAAMPALPSSLEGVPVEVRRTPKIRPHDGGGGCPELVPPVPDRPCHAEQLPLPTPMGQSTSNGLFCTSCTLGFKVCDPRTRVLGYVTNNHCNPDANGCENGPLGVAHFERGLFDNGCTFGVPPTADDFVGLRRCGTSERIVPLAPVGNLVDVAFIRSGILRSSRSVRDVGLVSGSPGTVALGECIRKSGRTSGLTFGRVAMVNATVNVRDYCLGTLQFIDQIVYDADTTCGQCANPGPGAVPCPISLGGDSGSPVLKVATREIVALNFAGPDDGSFGVGNRVQNVLSELGGLTLDLGRCRVFSSQADDKWEESEEDGEG
jgi:hypothetical protein